MGPPGWQQPPMGPSGQFGPPPPAKSGPPTGLIITLVVLVVAAVGALAFFLATGDDDPESVASERTDEEQPDGATDDSSVTTLPDDSTDTSDDSGIGDGVDTAPVDDEPGTGSTGSTLDAAGTWVYTHTPLGVDRTESTCIAQAVIDVAGEDAVASAGGDLSQVYLGTSSDQDEAIRSAMPACLDSDSLTAMEGIGLWPWDW